MPDPSAPQIGLFEALHTQRALRRFKPDPVPDDLLWRLLDAAIRAPSGSNQQPWGFVVVREPERRRAIGQMLRDHVQSNDRLKALLQRSESSADPSERRMLRGARVLFLELEHAPVLIIPCLYQVTSPRPDGLLAGSSIYPAVQNLLLAARGLGLGTVLTTFHAMFEQPLRTLLDLPPDAQPAALIPLGFPLGKFGPTNRRPVETVVHWERWGAQRAR